MLRCVCACVRSCCCGAAYGSLTGGFALPGACCLPLRGEWVNWQGHRDRIGPERTWEGEPVMEVGGCAWLTAGPASRGPLPWQRGISEVSNAGLLLLCAASPSCGRLLWRFCLVEVRLFSLFSFFLSPNEEIL